MGMTVAIFIHFGTWPVSNDLFINILKGIFRADLVSFRNELEMPSSPQLFLLFNRAIILFISSGSVGERNKEFFVLVVYFR